MTSEALIRQLDEVAAALPYAVDDYDAANETFRRWQMSKSRDDHDLLLTWLYCYARKYLIYKFIQYHRISATDIESLLSEIFRRSHQKLETVREPERFASYVSVACRNTFLNHLRTLWRRSEIEDFDGLASEDGGADLEAELQDASVVSYAVRSAVDRLPDTLQVVARLRLLDDLDYEVISERTGWPIPTIRSYASKAMRKLRQDPALIDFHNAYIGGGS